MPRATINDIPIDSKAPLTQEMKKALIKIIEDEYQNQTALSDQRKAEAISRVVDEFRAKYNIEELCQEYRSLEAQAEALRKRITLMGFNTNGDLYIRSTYSGAQELNAKGRALAEAIENVEKRFQEPRTEKNKIISRMLLAKTYGQAIVILQTVMGNGLLPEQDTTDVALLEYNEGGT